MSARWFHAAPVAALLSLVGADASADGMRCGQRLISSGDSLYEVRAVCGEPDAAERRVVTRTERRRVSGPCLRGDDGVLRCHRSAEVTVDVVLDQWTYDFGTQRLIRYVTFEDGRLVRVTTGGYGYTS